MQPCVLGQPYLLQQIRGPYGFDSIPRANSLLFPAPLFPPCSLDEGGEAFPKSNDLLNSGRNKPSLPGSTEVNKHNEASGS